MPRGPRQVLTLRPVSRPRLYEQILAQLQPLIQRGELRQGIRLPPERELATRLEISRSSLREAIRVLASRGMLEAQQGRGTFVKEPSVDRIAMSFAAALSRDPAEGQDVLDIMEFRKAFEPAVAASAALRATPSDLEDLRTILDQQRAKVETGRVAVEEDSRFHGALAVASKNQVFVRVVHRSMDLLQATRAQALQGGARARLSLEAHQRVLDAVRRGDPEGARQAMRAHLEEIEYLIRESRSAPPQDAKR